jgi:hypothetical protein
LHCSALNASPDVCSAVTPYLITGLVDAYAAACAALTSIIQLSTQDILQQQQRQRQRGNCNISRYISSVQMEADLSVGVVACLLFTWEVLTECFCFSSQAASALSASPRLSTAAPAFASLAVAVLQDPDTNCCIDDCKAAALISTGMLCTSIDIEIAAAKAAAKQAGDPHLISKVLGAALGGELLASADFAVLLAAYRQCVCSTCATRQMGRHLVVVNLPQTQLQQQQQVQKRMQKQR